MPTPQWLVGHPLNWDDPVVGHPPLEQMCEASVHLPSDTAGAGAHYPAIVACSASDPCGIVNAILGAHQRQSLHHSNFL